MVSDPEGSWRDVIILFVVGILGMMVVSAALPALSGIAAEFHPPSPATIGWVMSMPALAAALASLGVGWLVDRFGDRIVMAIGGMLVLASDLGVVLSDLLQTLLAWRVIGGLGYVCVVVAAVTMMTRLTHGRRRTIALALWSTVIPASFVVASLYGLILGDYLGWREVFIGHAAAIVMAVGACVTLLPPREANVGVNRLAGLRAVFRTPWPFLLGASFAAAAFLQTGFVAVLPRMLAEALGATSEALHSFNIVAMICNVIGAFSFGMLFARGVRPWQMGLAAALVCAVAGASLIFAPSSLGLAVVLNCALMFGLGILVGMWALLPTVAPSLSSLGATSGLITQITLIGVLFGPPSAFAAFAHGNGGMALYLSLGVIVSLVGWPIWRRSQAFRTVELAH